MGSCCDRRSPLQHLWAPTAACRGERRPAGGKGHGFRWVPASAGPETPGSWAWPARGHRREGAGRGRMQEPSRTWRPAEELSHADNAPGRSRLCHSFPALAWKPEAPKLAWFSRSQLPGCSLLQRQGSRVPSEAAPLRARASVPGATQLGAGLGGGRGAGLQAPHYSSSVPSWTARSGLPGLGAQTCV